MKYTRMLRSSKIEAITKWHWSMATIFEFICYHVHVARWLRKWPKWAIGSTSAAESGAWHIRKSPDNVNIRWYRDLSGKKGMEFSVRKILPASTCLQPQRTCTWNLKLKFQSKLELRCRNHAIQKPKNLIWPPGSHLETEVNENQLALTHIHKYFATEVRSWYSKPK